MTSASARFGLHRGITEGIFLEAWLAIRPSLCIPEGTPCRRPGARPRLERFSIGVLQRLVLFPLYSLARREAAKEAGSARSAPGGKCNSGRLRFASAAPCWVLMAPATARDAESVRTSPAVPEPARLAAAALLLLLGAGPAGCPPRLLLQPASALPLPVAGTPPAVRSGGSRPRKFQSLGLRE